MVNINPNLNVGDKNLCILKESNFTYKTQVKIKKRRKIYHINANSKRAGVAKLISNITIFIKGKWLEKKRHDVVTKGSILQKAQQV